MKQIVTLAYICLHGRDWLESKIALFHSPPFQSLGRGDPRFINQHQRLLNLEHRYKISFGSLVGWFRLA